MQGCAMVRCLILCGAENTAAARGCFKEKHMASESRNVREKQLEAATAELDAIVASLRDKGVDEKNFKKNALYRRAQANLRTARRRLLSMDKAVAHVAAMKEKDTKAAKADKAEKSAKKKAAAEPAEGAGPAAAAGEDGKGRKKK